MTRAIRLMSVALVLGLTPSLAAQSPSRAARLSERAHQDREIVYFPNDPSTHSFSLYHDYTESRAGVAHYFNIVRPGSTVSNPSAMLLDTGEALKVETITGAELKKRGLDAGARLGVVVIQVERMRRRVVREVNDLAILVGAIRQARGLGRQRRR